MFVDHEADFHNLLRFRKSNDSESRILAGIVTQNGIGPELRPVAERSPKGSDAFLRCGRNFIKLNHLLAIWSIVEKSHRVGLVRARFEALISHVMDGLSRTCCMLDEGRPQWSVFLKIRFVANDQRIKHCHCEGRL